MLLILSLVHTIVGVVKCLLGFNLAFELLDLVMLYIENVLKEDFLSFGECWSGAIPSK